MPDDPSVSITVSSSTDAAPPDPSPPVDPPAPLTPEQLLATVEALRLDSLAAASKAQDLAKQANDAQSDAVSKHSAFLDARKALEVALDSLDG